MDWRGLKNWNYVTPHVVGELGKACPWLNHCKVEDQVEVALFLLFSVGHGQIRSVSHVIQRRVIALASEEPLASRLRLSTIIAIRQSLSVQFKECKYRGFEDKLREGHSIL